MNSQGRHKDSTPVRLKVTYGFQLLEGDKTRRMNGTDTGTTIGNELVRAAVLSQIRIDHLRIYLDRVERLSVVHPDHIRDDFWHSNHLSQNNTPDRLLVTRRQRHRRPANTVHAQNGKEVCVS